MPVNDTLPLEIERRFLICRPSEEMLQSRCNAVYDMQQAYLQAGPGITERVRCRRQNGRAEYFHTEKTDCTARTRIERERKITEAEYERLLLRRDRQAQVICKRRWCLPWEGLVFEIDVYPFWPGLAVMEVELPHEDTEFSFPGGIRVLREVTENRLLSNAALARHIPPQEELLRMP